MLAENYFPFDLAPIQCAGFTVTEKTSFSYEDYMTDSDSFLFLFFLLRKNRFRFLESKFKSDYAASSLELEFDFADAPAING